MLKCSSNLLNVYVDYMLEHVARQRHEQSIEFVSERSFHSAVTLIFIFHASAVAGSSVFLRPCILYLKPMLRQKRKRCLLIAELCGSIATAFCNSQVFCKKNQFWYSITYLIDFLLDALGLFGDALLLPLLNVLEFTEDNGLIWARTSLKEEKGLMRYQKRKRTRQHMPRGNQQSII
ncbi:unnamed protein product [Cylicocyclus nassatus]|uniref:Uncharacterized protein n=1 Tax=Cylicocyclus nassatus TaxID=53992 RepID=A0AA36H8X5_CYLNA|nr:unnamed protein product [Cylicocyclus nassatus]